MRQALLSSKFAFASSNRNVARVPIGRVAVAGGHLRNDIRGRWPRRSCLELGNISARAV